MEEYIKLLELPEEFDLNDLKMAYRKKVLQYHPDKATNAAERIGYEAVIKKINEANKYLKEYLENHGGVYSKQVKGNYTGEENKTRNSRTFDDNDSVLGKLAIGLMRGRGFLNIIFNIYTLIITCIWLIIIHQFSQVFTFIFIIGLSPFILGLIIYILIFIPQKLEFYCYEKKENLLGLFFSCIIQLLLVVVAFNFYYNLSYDLLWSNKNITWQNIIPIFFITYFSITVPYDFMAKRDDGITSYVFANCFSLAVFIGLFMSIFISLRMSAILMLCILLLTVPINLYIKKEYLKSQKEFENFHI